MKLAVLYSGGKDSNYALYKAMEEHEITCLISVFSENKESYMFHVPNIHLVEMQAEAMEKPIVIGTTKGEKEKELADLENSIRKAVELHKIEGLVTGAIASKYQADRIEKICKDIGIECINPLWGIEANQLLRELVEKKFRVLITGIAGYPLEENWLGRDLNPDSIKELAEIEEKYGLSSSGEGGEIETTVLDAPFFKKKIEIDESKKEAKANTGVLYIIKAHLKEKN